MITPLRNFHQFLSSYSPHRFTCLVSKTIQTIHLEFRICCDNLPSRTSIIPRILVDFRVILPPNHDNEVRNFLTSFWSVERPWENLRFLHWFRIFKVSSIKANEQTLKFPCPKISLDGADLVNTIPRFPFSPLIAIYLTQSCYFISAGRSVRHLRHRQLRFDFLETISVAGSGGVLV